MVTGCFVWYVASAALEGRWRDVRDGGIPALLLAVGFPFAIWREWRRLREMWERGE